MKLRTRFERFCLRNRDKGIPNLMLYIVIGCGVVAILRMLGYSQIYNLLCFDKALILRGQVWRLFTYVFTMIGGNALTLLIFLYCYYSLGRAVENGWGTFKFNLYYLASILLMDAFAMIFDGNTLLYSFSEGQMYTVDAGISNYYGYYMTDLLHLSLVICYATLYPESQFTLFFIIPIKAKILSLIYLGYVIYEVVSWTVPIAYLPHNLFPLVAMLPYFLFFGKDVQNLLPLSWQVRHEKKKIIKAQEAQKARKRTEPIPFRKGDYATPNVDYKHRCTVCGRTDVTNPELEFRYCSRCAGYYCYCQDHISNHTHIE